MKDAIITEMHAIKDAISAQYDHDPGKLVAALMARQKKQRKRLIRVPNPKIAPR